MHVLIYSHAYPNPVEEYRSAFVREIIRFLPTDIKVTVLAPIPYFLGRRRGKPETVVPQVRHDEIGEKIVEVFHPRYPLLPKNYLRPIMGFLEAIFTFRCLRSIHVQHHIDLIHVNWVFPNGIAVYYLTRLIQIPYIVTEHQGSIADLLAIKYYNRLIRKAYNNSNRLIIVSESLLKPLQMITDHLPQPIVITNGVDIQRFGLVTKSSKLSKLVFIGNLIPGKGVDNLLYAFEKLKNSGKEFHLDIIGKGDQATYLANLVKKLQLTELVSFKGVIHPDEIPLLLINYDLLILPTLVESFGIVLIEAMASGIPVLSTLSGGPEYIVTNVVGYLVKPGSVDALVEGIEDIDKRWESFRPEAIREYCRKRYDLTELCVKLANVYRGVLKENEK